MTSYIAMQMNRSSVWCKNKAIFHTNLYLKSTLPCILCCNVSVFHHTKCYQYHPSFHISFSAKLKLQPENTIKLFKIAIPLMHMWLLYYDIIWHAWDWDICMYKYALSCCVVAFIWWAFQILNLGMPTSFHCTSWVFQSLNMQQMRKIYLSSNASWVKDTTN